MSAVARRCYLFVHAATVVNGVSRFPLEAGKFDAAELRSSPPCSCTSARNHGYQNHTPCYASLLPPVNGTIQHRCALVYRPIVLANSGTMVVVLLVGGAPRRTVVGFSFP